VDDAQKELDRLIALGGSALGSLPEGGGAVYARDPFGNMIELCQIPSPEENPTQLPGVSTLGDFDGSP
jgi:topoisomerase IA-like protein